MQNKPKVICLGNEFIKEDSLAIKLYNTLKEDLKNFDFIEIIDSFSLVNYLNDEIIIIDVVLGINEVTLLNINQLKTDGIYSSHDFDAGFFLKLIGETDKIKIIGLPMQGELDEIKKQVIFFLNKIRNDIK